MVYKTKQERQDEFVESVGRKRAEALQRLWNNSWPRFCSLGDELPRNHTKEEVFKNSAENAGFKGFEINMFLSL